MSVKDYDRDPDLNSTISGINVAEGCPPSGINNAIRQIMADMKEESEAQTQAWNKAVVDGDTLSLAAAQAAQNSADAAGAAAQAAQQSADAASGEVQALDTALRALIAAELAKYLPLAGGKMSGALDMGAQELRHASAIEMTPNVGASHGGHIDFHHSGDSSVDFTSRIAEFSRGKLSFDAPNGVVVNSKQIVRSVNGASADAAGNVVLSGLTAAAVSGVVYKAGSTNYGSGTCSGEHNYTLPSGGTWRYATWVSGGQFEKIGQASGGTTISGYRIIAIRVA